MYFLAWLENTSFSTFVRESELFYYFLFLHSVGMGFLVGTNAMIDLRILGFAPRLPLAPMDRFFRIMWFGFWVNAVTGVVLLAQAATTHLMDPVMYIKLTSVALAVVMIPKLRSHASRSGTNPHTTPVATPGKILAATSLALWALAITCGRLTAYEFYRGTLLQHWK